MANLVIVAIPEEDDYVHKISSEQMAHMTIVFLGETSSVDNMSKIIEYVEHAAKMSLTPFGLSVDYRDTLGPDQADVLFFKKDKYSFDQVAQFRSYLLKEPNIFKAYNSIPQYDEWTPHLTLGYPETPAKEMEDRDYGIHYVHFDRIAVWFGDYTGFEFRLKYPEYDSLEVAMGVAETGADAVEDIILSHFGVKGMHWGVRKDRATAVSVKTTQGRKFTKTKVSAKGGQGQPANPDAIAAKAALQKYKKSGPSALSNQELQILQTRLNLEANVHRLSPSEMDKLKKGARWTTKFLKSDAGQATTKYAAGYVWKKFGKQHSKRIAAGLATAAIALP